MSDWVHIEPPVPHLTPAQERIREMLRAGMTLRQICVKLMMRSDHLRDEFFEIRKYEVMMGKGKTLTQEQKATIVEMGYAGVSHKEIALQVGCAVPTVSNVISAYRKKARYAERATGINKEFDDAVNEMIAEAAAQEPETEPEPVQIVPAVPDAVIRAVEDKITELQTMIRDNTERIESLKQHNKKFTERIEILGEWLKEVQA